MEDSFREFIHAELDCIKRETCCGGIESDTKLNLKAIEWIKQNAHKFRDDWNRSHSLTENISNIDKE